MIIKTKKGFSALFVFLFILLFKRANESDNAVDNEEYTCYKDYCADKVAESKQNTKCDRKYGKYNAKRVLFLCLKCIKERNESLDCDQNTEDKENDVLEEASEDEYRDTDDKADRAT